MPEYSSLWEVEEEENELPMLKGGEALAASVQCVSPASLPESTLCNT